MERLLSDDDTSMLCFDDTGMRAENQFEKEPHFHDGMILQWQTPD